MFYSLVKIICSFFIKVYYGKIEINGFDSLPRDMPLLLACNHPTGFLEPIIIACVLDRDLHFITRGDLFSSSWLGPILRLTNQIPIWRFKDGVAGLRQNKQSIDMAEKALRNGGALLMFVEGRTEDIKMLKPLQKGMARISTSLHDQNLEHRIIPIGINFLDTVTWRSRIMLNFGKPFNSRPIKDTNTEVRKAHAQINEVISKEIKTLMLHCPDRKVFPIHDKLLNLYQGTIKNTFSPIIEKSKSNFSQFKTISDVFVALPENEQQNLGFQLDEIDVSGKNIHSLQVQDKRLCSLVLLILLLPIAMLGMVVNLLPILLGLTVERTLVKSREFVAPIRFAASMGFALVYYILLLIIGVSMYGIAGTWVLIGPFLGWVFLYWNYHFRNVSKKYGLSPESVERLIPIFTLLKK